MLNNSGNEDNVLNIDEGIKNVYSSAFSCISYITEINFPSTLESFSVHTLIGLDNLEKVTFDADNKKYRSNGPFIYERSNNKLLVVISKSNEITLEPGTIEISDSAFQKCKSLKIINLNNELEIINQQAFSGTQLKSLYIGENVRYIDPLFIYGISTFEQLIISENNNNYKTDNNFLYTKDGKEIVAYLKNEENVKIPEGVEKICHNVFHNKEIKNIIIPNTIKEIDSSFNYCNGLTSINIPNSVEKIASGCFYYCNNLTSINIDNTQNSIEGAPWGSPYGMRIVNWLR